MMLPKWNEPDKIIQYDFIAHAPSLMKTSRNGRYWSNQGNIQILPMDFNKYNTIPCIIERGSVNATQVIYSTLHNRMEVNAQTPQRIRNITSTIYNTGCECTSTIKNTTNNTTGVHQN